MAAIFIREVSITMEFLVKNGQRQGWPLLNACQQANARIHTSCPSRRSCADSSGASCYSRNVNVFADTGVPIPGGGGNLCQCILPPDTLLSCYINIQISSHSFRNPLKSLFSQLPRKRGKENLYPKPHCSPPSRIALALASVTQLIGTSPCTPKGC